MNEIPDVSFAKRDQQYLEFDVISLRSLFARGPAIKDHSPELPHRLHFFILMFITEGAGSHFVDLKPYTYKKGSLIFIAKGQVHSFRRNLKNDGHLILFTENFLQKNMVRSDHLSLHRLFNYHLYTPVLQPEECQGQGMAEIVGEIVHEFGRTDQFAKEEILHSLLRILLLKMERVKRVAFVESGQTERLVAFTNFKTLVEQYFAETRNAVDYADMLHISYKHLNRVCKSITGLTAKSFIDQHIVLETKRQLVTTDTSIKELTYQLGFDEVTNLVKFFKKHTHETPAQFRKAISR